MTDEVSVHIRLSVLVFLTAGLLASVVNILIMGMSVLNNYTTKYSFGLASSSAGSLLSISTLPKVAAPTAYSTVLSSIDSVEEVVFITLDMNDDEIRDCIYKLDNSVDDRLIELMTIYRTSDVNITLIDSTNIHGLYSVEVRLVE